VSDSNVIKLVQPGVFTDSLTEVLRSGARALLTQAVEAEVAEFLAKHADLKTETGHQRVVRHGHLPERDIMTGVGPVTVRQPRVRDRASGDGERIRYSPAILPRYARRSKSLEVLIPILYLKGISTGDFEEVLAALVGDARHRGTPSRKCSDEVAIPRRPPHSVFRSPSAARTTSPRDARYVPTGCPSRRHQSSPPSSSLVRNPKRESL
jgi:transposase-like protein